MDRKQHWEGVYTGRPAGTLSWFQREPALSLRLIESVGLTPGS
jgi:hypothetical protein